MDTLVAKAVEQWETQPDVDEMEKLAGEIVPEFAEIAASVLASKIKRDAKRGLKRSQRQRTRFEKSLGKHWAKPLHLLELTVELAEEVGTTVIQESGSLDGGGDARTHTSDALMAIHARGCQTSHAILALLRSGFADDAHARWRTLHELAVVSNFISEHGDDVAERYLLHEVVEQRKLAMAYKKHEIRAKLDPLTRAEIEALDERYNALIARYGKAFGRDYGWAASTLRKERPTFVALEEAVELDHLRPYYQMANQNVHPNSHAAFFKLGLDETGQGEVLLAGPSNLGLADPGHGAALSLTQITAALVTTVSPTIDGVVGLMIVNLMQNETGEAFLEAHKQAELIAQHEVRQRSHRDGGMEGSHRRSPTIRRLRDRITARLGTLAPKTRRVRL